MRIGKTHSESETNSTQLKWVIGAGDRLTTDLKRLVAAPRVERFAMVSCLATAVLVSDRAVLTLLTDGR